MDKNPIRGETYVRIALLALMLVSIGFLVVRGIVIVQAQQSLAAAEGASAASTPSKKDTLTPQCAAATKNNEKLAQYGVREDIRTQMPVEYNKSIKEAATDGFCKSEYKVKESWGEGCNSKKCPMGVTVFPPGTKLSPGVVQCSTDSKGFVVACRNNPDAEQPSKQDTGTQPGKSTEQLAKDAAKTDAGQGGGQGGGSGGGSGSGQTPSNEALDKVFGEQNPTAKEEPAKIAEQVAGAQERLDNAGKALDEYYDNGGKRGTTEETKLLSEYNDASKTKDQLIDEARYARADFESKATQLGTPSTAEDLAKQNNYNQKADALGRLIDNYGTQGAGQQTDTARDAGVPFKNGSAPEYMTGIQKDSIEHIVGDLQGNPDRRRGDTFLPNELSVSEARALEGQKIDTIASRYRDPGDSMAGSEKTASGAIIKSGDTGLYSVAHKTLPFGTIVEVANPANGESIAAVVNNRGPYVSGRGLDLNPSAANALGISQSQGVAPVDYTVRYVPPVYTYGSGRSDYLVGITPVQSQNILRVVYNR